MGEERKREGQREKGERREEGNCLLRRREALRRGHRSACLGWGGGVCGGVCEEWAELVS